MSINRITVNCPTLRPSFRKVWTLVILMLTLPLASAQESQHSGHRARVLAVDNSWNRPSSIGSPDCPITCGTLRPRNALLGIKVGKTNTSACIHLCRLDARPIPYQHAPASNRHSTPRFDAQRPCSLCSLDKTPFTS